MNKHALPLTIVTGNAIVASGVITGFAAVESGLAPLASRLYQTSAERIAAGLLRIAVRAQGLVVPGLEFAEASAGLAPGGLGAAGMRVAMAGLGSVGARAVGGVVHDAVEGGVRVTQEGLAAVTEHLAQFGEHAPNTAMLARLQSALGSAITGADANFYTHELLEAGHMASGMSYEAAHAAALEQAGVSPFSLYHPEVIQQFPAEFNNAWRAFWGL